MNTKVLPNEIRRLLNQPRQYVYLLGLAVVVALGAVLFLTVLRVQNQKPTIDRPQAAENPAWCANPPSCCANMATGGYDACGWPERGQCRRDQCDAAEGKGTNNCAGNGLRCDAKCPSGTTLVGGSAQCSNAGGGCQVSCSDGKSYGGTCIENNTPRCRCAQQREAYCTGGGGGGGGANKCGAPDKDIACANNCVDNIRPGNCSYCRACCAAGNCSATTGGGGAVKVFVKNSDGSNYNQGGTVRMTGTSACAACNSKCADPVCNPNREKTYNAGSGSVSWSDSSKGANYNFLFVGGAGGNCSAPAGGSCTITVGGGGGGCEDDSDCGNKVCVDGACVNKKQSHLECVSSACKRVAGAGNDQNGCTTVGATCNTGNTCVDSQCPTGQSCFNNSCQVYHLGCGSDSTCTKLQGAGQNTCTTVGSSCDGGNTCVDSQCPTGQACFSGSCKAYHFGCTSSNVCAKLQGAGANTSGCIAAGQVCGGELGSCWGNGGVNGRCIDCNGDGIINILDFSCLACNWSEKFTPDQNPSCRSASEE